MTSAAVAAQYEAHPYPRLVGVHRRAPQPLAAAVRGLVPTLPPDTDLPSPAGKLRVLVAGCGTGQHALTTATRLADADVLAVDLSRASLARAQRRAAEWALPNLRFAAADLLALGDLDQRFDLIESVGVLHHLDDPLRGWRALAGLLSPGGLMQVGLYSERGRSEVVAARALIAAEGLTADDAGLRAARRLFRALPPDHPAWPVVRSPDFYSLSGLRDLLFHACEHRTSPLGVAAMLDALGLRLLGLQHPRAEIAALYAHRFPDDPAQADLARWEALEIDHPRIFSGMMVLWCQTPTSPDNAESAPTTEGAPVSGAGQ